jgi:hypothetical protein
MTKLLETKEGRDQLVWACRFADNPEVHHTRRWTSGEYDACEAVADPNKLAELIASEMHRCGVLSSLRTNDIGAALAVVEFIPLPNRWCPSAEPAIGVYLRAIKEDFDLTMPQARTVLATLIALPERADVEAMLAIRGKS